MVPLLPFTVEKVNSFLNEVKVRKRTSVEFRDTLARIMNPHPSVDNLDHLKYLNWYAPFSLEASSLKVKQLSR